MDASGGKTEKQDIATVGPHHEVSVGDRVPTEARDAWDVVASIAVACRIQPRSPESARALALAGARAQRKLASRQKPAVAAVAALPRAQVLNADAAAVAFARTPREGGAVAVIGVETTAANRWIR